MGGDQYPVEVLGWLTRHLDHHPVAEANHPLDRAAGPDRLARSVAVTESTYAREPPSTVRQRGRPRSESNPWLSRKRARKPTGNSSIRAGSADQTDETIGTTTRSIRSSENPPSVRKAWRVGPSSSLLAEFTQAALEPRHLGQHAKEGRIDQVAAAGEESAQVAAGELEVTVTHREAHRGRPAGHFKLFEHRRELRVVPFVEDDEAGVDPLDPAFGFDLDRVRVATGPGVSFEDLQVEGAVQMVRGEVTGRPRVRRFRSR